MLETWEVVEQVGVKGRQAKPHQDLTMANVIKKKPLLHVLCCSVALLQIL